MLLRATRPADLDTELQLIAAYVTSPGWRQEPYRKSLDSLTDNLSKLDTSPMALFSAKFPELLHPGDARWAYPTSADIQKAKLDGKTMAEKANLDIITLKLIHKANGEAIMAGKTTLPWPAYMPLPPIAMVVENGSTTVSTVSLDVTK